MTSHDWSVRYTRPGTAAQDVMGGTGFTAEQFARDVFDGLKPKVRESGGKVEILKDGVVIEEFPEEAKG